MIAVDTSSLIGFFSADGAQDNSVVRAALRDEQLVLPPVVLAEASSDPFVKDELIDYLNTMSLLDLRPEYWARVGQMRRVILQQGLKAKLGDALIAQSCIDHDVPLITRDKDFRHYAKHCGLKLYA